MTDEQLNLLLKLTNFRSENLILAIKDHLLFGIKAQAAADKHEIDKSILSRRLKSLKETERIVKDLARFYPAESNNNQ